MQSNDSRTLDALNNAFNHLLQNQDLLEKRLAHVEELLQVQTASATAVQPVATVSSPIAEAVPVELLTAETEPLATSDG